MKCKSYLLRLSTLLTALVLVFLLVPCTGSLPAFAENDVQKMSKAEAQALIKKSALFDAIYEGVKNRQTKIDVKELNCTVEEFHATAQSISYYCADLFYVDNLAYSRDGDTVTSVYPLYMAQGEELDLLIAEYDAMLEELLTLGSSDWSDLQIVLFYHDYLTAHYEYDLNYEIYDAFGFLKNKKGVCLAYTLVFGELMKHYDVPCTYVQSNNLNHIWNAVFVDGFWYHLDATFDDPLYSGGTQPHDNPGWVGRTHCLVGSKTNDTFNFSSTPNDMIYGAPVPISSENHPKYELWFQSGTRFLELNGHFYGIIKDQFKQRVFLSLIDFDQGSYTPLLELDRFWHSATGEICSYNCSFLCTDGKLLYYNDEDEVFSCDPDTKISTVLASESTDEQIYGLRLEDGVLAVYTAPNSTAVRNVFYVEIGSVLPGDVDEDLAITIADVTSLLKYLADADSCAVNKNLADIDADESITIADVTELLSILAKQ